MDLIAIRFLEFNALKTQINAFEYQIKMLNEEIEKSYLETDLYKSYYEVEQQKTETLEQKIIDLENIKVVIPKSKPLNNILLGVAIGVVASTLIVVSI